MNRRNRLRWGIVLLSGGVILSAVAVSQHQQWLERFYVGFSQTLSGLISALSGPVPFSLAEASLLGAAIWVAATGFGLLRRRKDGAGALTLIGRAAASTVTAGLVVAALFYLLWGLNYSRPPLAVRLGWTYEPPSTTSAEQELIDLCRRLIEATNQTHGELRREASDLKGLSADELRNIDRALESGFAATAHILGLGDYWRRPRGPAKPLLLSSAASWIGLTGFYFPWTGEANFNDRMPLLERPLAIAHEKAHQRGIAPEDEANFVGWLACMHSDNPLARYSGLVFAQRQLLWELAAVDRQQALQLVRLRHPGVQSDIEAGDRYWRGRQSVASRASRRVNNLYLKSQGVERGIESYRLSSLLIVLYARIHGISGGEA